MEELMAMKTVVNRSRFHAHLYSIEDPMEVKDIVKEHRKRYKKANHHCWALRTGNEGTITTDFKNDGEVGHPGKILLEILEKYDQEGMALVVSRIFGGIKLGVGGVSRAFREAGEAVIAEWSEQKENQSSSN